MDRRRTFAAAVAVAALLGACTSGGDPTVSAAGAATSTSTTSTSSTSTTAAPTTTTTSTTTTIPVTTTVPPPPRVVYETGFAPFAHVGGVTLLHPAALVERVGFHESNHDGAQQLEVLETAAAPIVLETRERGTGSQTAADVVVDPETEIRSPVTGTVLRSGGYTLYCDYRDDYAVIEPDDHPGWEVKVLHIDGVQVNRGDRVVAGETLLAPRSRILAFESQVNETAAVPPWPHVHIEVVDPTIPDRPSPDGGCP